MFRPLRNLARRNNPLNASQIEVLARANELVRNGQSAQAAPLFVELAREMEASQHPRMAANLHAQAAHTYANNSDGQGALTHARAALTLFIQYQMVQRAPIFYGNITRKLSAKGLQPAADALQKEFGGRIGTFPAPVASGPARRPGRLPANCPKCGAPVHGSVSAGEEMECDYCGTGIRADD